MIKKLLPFLFIVFSVLNSSAQLTLQSDSVYLTESPPPSFEIVVKNFLKNTSSDTVEYRWRRVLEDVPQSWESSVCDEIQCWFPAVNTNGENLITIPPGDSTNLDVHFFNEGRVGEGYVEVIAFDVADSANTVVTAKFYGKAENDPNVSIRNVEKNSFNIYPNPAQNSINIKGLNHVSANAMIEIYSIIGVKVAELKYNYQAVDVSNLQRGVYLLKIADNNKNYSQTFIKE